MNGLSAIDQETQLVAESRERAGARLSPRERATHGLTALVLAAAAAGLAASGLPWSGRSWLLAAAFTAAVAVAASIELEVGSGFASPVVLVLLPALFALPPGAAPLVVALGLVAGQLPAYLRARIHPERLLVAVANASYTLAPAAAFLLLGGSADSDAGRAALAAAALLSQFAADAVLSAVRERCALGARPRSLVGPLLWVFTVDACLAPVALAAALAGARWTPAYFLPLPLLLLTRLFASERAGRLSHALDLSAAYRGTALLLGDVIEADDEYTGAHSWDVVKLATDVAGQLGLDARTRHLVEMTALLHDVGKIRIPDAIINKPGPLTPAERTIIETHTIEGERLLSHVGGLLGEVGTIVRSCHEAYDGRGYPDGLAGERIPLAARIVACCDAFSAMTTTRPYRAALSADDARAELRRNRGTQFDPHVVDALLAVLEAGSAHSTALDAPAATRAAA